MARNADTSSHGPERDLPTRRPSSRSRIGRSRTTWSARALIVLALVGLAAAVGGGLGAAAVGGLRGGPSVVTTVDGSGALASGVGSKQSSAPAAPQGAGSGGSDPAAVSDPAAFYAGRAMRGNGDTVIALTRAQQLANQPPSGATIDTSTNTVRFAGATVSFVVLASPPAHDMKFQVAGLTDPTIEVVDGARVSVRFINGDNDMAHMWLVDSGAATAGASTMIAARPLGDPTPDGHPAEMISFTASRPGAYQYYCAFPGHAAQGMRGQFWVKAS